MQTRSEETRARLLDAAMRLFSSYGYNAASVDEICEAAGVSKGAFYHHFASKQAIFLALFEDWLASVDSGLEAARKPTVPETFRSMASMMPLLASQADGYLPMFLEFWLQASRDETIWQATIAPYQRYQDYFASLIEQGIAEGSFRPLDALAAAKTIVSMAVGLLLQSLIAPGGTDWQKAAEESMEILMKGIAKP